MTGIQLVVQADDLGMCHAVNEGIEAAFRHGIVTQATAMAPCPWIAEGVEIARRLRMPTGMHATLTSEWAHLRWAPLTDGASLVERDGSFHRTVQEAIDKVDADEGTAELEAQLDRLRALGLEPLFIDCHHGPTCRPAFETLTRRHGKRFIYPLAELAYTFDSLQMLTPRADDQKLDWLLEWLGGLEPGLHFLCTHPGMAGAELAGLTHADADNRPWAEAWRDTDLAVLTDARVRERIDELGIALVSVDRLHAG